jgi:TonB family protein
MTSLTSEQKNLYTAAFYSVLFNLALLAFATLMHSGAKQVIHSSAIQIKYLPGLTKQVKKKSVIRKKINKIIEKKIPSKEPEKVNAKPDSTSDENVVENETLPDIVPLAEVTRMPQFLNRIEPYYPEDERNAGKEALVITEIVVDTRGRILEVSIIKSGGAEFDQAVLNSINKSSFVPGYVDGSPVVVRLQIPFRFNLR